MTVDECRRNERTIKINGLGVRELRLPHRIIAQPGHHTITHCHRGGIRV